MKKKERKKQMPIPDSCFSLLVCLFVSLCLFLFYIGGEKQREDGEIRTLSQGDPHARLPLQLRIASADGGRSAVVADSGRGRCRRSCRGTKSRLPCGEKKEEKTREISFWSREEERNKKQRNPPESSDQTLLAERC